MSTLIRDTLENPCWNLYCIAGDCDGVDHVDTTGYTWTQKRGQEFNPATGDYEYPVNELGEEIIPPDTTE